MQDNIKENILNELKRKDGKRIIICQTGFISTKFLVNCLNYRIEYDTLTIQDEKEGVYLSINLNQVYKYEIKDSKIKIYLDNDSIIIISEDLIILILKKIYLTISSLKHVNTIISNKTNLLFYEIGIIYAFYLILIYHLLLNCLN